MKTIKLEEAIDRDIGKIGTPERDKFEADLNDEIKKANKIKQECLNENFDTRTKL